jgi:hypothetical protein
MPGPIGNISLTKPFWGMKPQPEKKESDCGVSLDRSHPGNGEEVDRNPDYVVPLDSKDFSCGGKKYCRDMTSCEEAKFHLQECGLTRLDGDGDGVPCEAICR